MGVFFIKLGSGGEWEADSIANNRMRFGWSEESLTDLNTPANWPQMEARIRSARKTAGAGTMDWNALRSILTSVPEDVWITFHDSHLYWCHLLPARVERDDKSKYRLVDQWKNEDTLGRPLVTTQLPGAIASLQGFRGTVCRVKDEDEAKKETILIRLIHGQTSPLHQQVDRARQLLGEEVTKALSELHWKDFEVLVDLLFRQAGWRRISVLGETMKLVDLELEAPISKLKYQVQVKSTATLQEFEKARVSAGFEKLFFFVHKPEAGLVKKRRAAGVELMLPPDIANMVVDSGLVDWVLAKVR